MQKVWGKIVGGSLGFAAGGPLGAVVGFLIGHVHDIHSRMAQAGGSDPWTAFAESYNNPFAGNVRQASFTMGVIVLGAKMAKADGRVTRAEIEAFKRVFQVQPAQEAQIGRLFDQARQSAQGFEPYAFQLSQTFPGTVLEEILSGLFIIAAADSATLSPAELNYLKRVASIFGFDSNDFVRIAARSGVHVKQEQSSQNRSQTQYPRDETENAYDILGVKASMTVEEIKTAYRTLIREHHPDKLMAQGMPAEFVATSTEKMKRINVAYDTICKIRGIK